MGLPPTTATGPGRRSPDRAVPRRSLLAAQIVGQGTRVAFHLVAADRLGIAAYGRFVVIFASAVVLATFVDLGMRQRMQFLLASATAPAAGAVAHVSPWVTIAVCVPAIVGSVTAGGAVLFSTTLAAAMLLAIGLSASEIVGETLKGEGRPVLGIMLPAPAMFLVPTVVLLLVDDVTAHELAVLVSCMGAVIVIGWTVRQLRRLGLPPRPSLGDLGQIRLVVMISSALAQTAVLIPVLFASSISTADAGSLSIALRIVVVLSVTAGAIGTPTIRDTARAYFRDEPTWPHFRAGLQRIVLPTTLVAALCAVVIVNPLQIAVLEAGNVTAFAWILIPGMFLGAITGPVTPTLFAVDQVAPTIVASVVAIAAVLAGGVLAVATDEVLYVAISLSVSIALQNLYQLRVVRRLGSVRHDG